MADRDEHDHEHEQTPHIYRPIPRRTFATQHRDASSPTSALPHTAHSPSPNLQPSRSSDFLAQLNARLLRTYNARSADDLPESPVSSHDGNGSGNGNGNGSARLPRQNKSFLSLARGSTLLGIYDDVGTEAPSVVNTPWGTGAETPGHTGGGAEGGGLSMKSVRGEGVGKQKGRAGGALVRRRSSQTGCRRRGAAKYAVRFAKLAALFTFGILYGLIVSHLHDTRQLAAVHVTGVDRKSWVYVSLWGSAGVALGSLLPYIDLLWKQHSPASCSLEEETENEKEGETDGEVPVSEQINDVVRSVAAFVGVAFAIRRLPWQSTLQLTLTLALVNPALWYILDRSKPGLSFSLIVTSILTSLMFLSNPTALPSPSVSAGGNATYAASSRQRPDLFAGMVSYDKLAAVTWVGSVLFCSCVCFGSIGRRLAVLEGGWKR